MTPQLVDAYKSKKGNNVEFILMNYDDSQKSMDKYMVKSKINFPGLKNGERESNYLSKVFEAKGLPSLVVTDANGKVISSGVGGIKISKVLAKIKTLK